MTLLNKITNFTVKLFLLNTIFVLTVVLSLGILTGPAMVSLFFLSKQTIDGDLELYGQFRKFWDKLREKFKYAFILSIFIFIFIYFILTNLGNLRFFDVSAINIVYALQMIALFELLMISIYGFYLHANYKFDSFKNLMTTAIFFVNRFILISILILLTILIIGWTLISFSSGFLLIFTFGIIFAWISLLFKPIFKKFEIISEET